MTKCSKGGSYGSSVCDKKSLKVRKELKKNIYITVITKNTDTACKYELLLWV